MRVSAIGLSLLALASVAAAQSNVIPGTDVSLGAVSSLTGVGHSGTFPTGTGAFAMSTTSCNLGTVDVPWLQAMLDNHPYIAFMVVREKDGRLVQISDRSFVKHGFFALSNSQCTPCQHPSNGTFLGVGCSDTYAVGNNSDNFWLAPADEVNAWLGTWNPVCSFFDKGSPPVAPPQDCDGFRSFTQTQANALGPVGNRVRVQDSDINNQPGANFYYQGYYVIRGEPEAVRENNFASRKFTAAWTGSSWNVSTTGSQLQGSILKRWTGATVTSNTNGADDGRVYVAVVVTGPNNGLYHYEYAVQNRDNQRGVSSFEIPMPLCGAAQNVGFRDVDANAANDWTVSSTPGSLQFTTATNPLKWNMLFNFFFDSPAAPGAGSVSMAQFLPGPGAASISVPTTLPSSLGFSNYGAGTPGCSGDEHLCANSPPSINNAAFAFTCDNTPPSSLGLGIIGDVAIPGGADPIGLGFTLLIHLFTSTSLFSVNFNSDAAGNATAPAPIPNDPTFVGVTLNAQGLFVWSGGPCVPSPFLISTSNGVSLTFLP